MKKILTVVLLMGVISSPAWADRDCSATWEDDQCTVVALGYEQLNALTQEQCNGFCKQLHERGDAALEEMFDNFKAKYGSQAFDQTGQ